MPKIFDEIAKATDLREGAEGVRLIFETVAKAGNMPLKDIARSIRMPLPVVSAVRRELEKRRLFVRDKGAALSDTGLALAAKIGIGKSAASDMPALLPGHIIPDSLKYILAEMAAISSEMPQVDVQLDQAFGTPETALRRALYASATGCVAGRNLLFLGDDDLVSVAVALLASHFPSMRPAHMTVIEIDTRIGALIEAHGRRLGAEIECVPHDLRTPLPENLAGIYDAFFTDPPYTAAGLKLFLSRAAEALKKRPGLHGFLSFAHCDPDRTVELHRTISELGFAASEIIPDFNTYTGAQMLCGSSQLIHLLTSNHTKPAFKEQFDEPIFTGEVNISIRLYKCTECGFEINVGADCHFNSIESLKNDGCTECKNIKFRLIKKSSAEKDNEQYKKTTQIAQKNIINQTKEISDSPEQETSSPEPTAHAQKFSGVELFTVTPVDAEFFKSEFDMSQARAWCCFTPFLCALATHGKEILWRPSSGGPIILYKKQKQDGALSWDLYTLAARSETAAKEAVELLDHLNKNQKGRILWVPENQLQFISSIKSLKPEFRDTEYFYSCEDSSALEGPEFSDVRKRATRFKREHPDFEISPLTPDQIPECLTLLDTWTHSYDQRPDAPPLLDHDYTIRAIEIFDKFSAPDFFGWTLKINGSTSAFALAGEMTPGLANFFALKTDLTIFGLATFFRHYVLTQLYKKSFSLANDASDLNTSGLQRHKSKFRPVSRLKIFKVSRIKKVGV